MSPTVVHVIDSLHFAAGGPSRTVVQLADALVATGGVDVFLLSQGAPAAAFVPSREPRVMRRLVQSPSSTRMRMGLAIRAELERIVDAAPIALIHNHGLWKPANYWAARVARGRGLALITHPRGMLEPWALKHKGWKKRIAMRLYQRSDLDVAKALVATGQGEYESIRRLGLRAPVAIIPNGVDLRDVAAPIRAREGGARTALFLGRVHPVKGLLNLVHAWQRVSPADWRLVIAGPDEAGHLAEVMGLARKLGVERSVQFVGAVEGEAKAELYRRADLFILPTFNENFGVVVAEALAHGVPAITTRAAPWAALEEHACGWWIDIGVEPLVAAMREAMALSEEERHEMGVRGKGLVEGYDWGTIARQMIALYLWVLGQGDRPENVRLD